MNTPDPKKRPLTEQRRIQIVGSGINGVRYLLAYVDHLFDEFHAMRMEYDTKLARLSAEVEAYTKKDLKK
jgi:hypothetical protein